MLLEKNHPGSILLLDPLELRRESIRSLLEPWAHSLSLDLVVRAPELLADSTAASQDLRLAVIVIGGKRLGDPSQLDILKRLKQELADVPCAVISDNLDPDEAILAASAGVQAFLTSAMPPDMANHALTFVLAGGTYFPREALLASRPNHQPGARHVTEIAHAHLTIRQCEVLERLRYGMSNKHIARELNMQEATVKVHVRQIMRKLGAANRTQVALLAQSGERRSGATPHGNGALAGPSLASRAGLATAHSGAS